MGAGGNCGSQASTLTIRGLALGEVELKDIFKLLWKEVRVGLVVGAALSVVTFALYTFWLGDMDATIAQRIPTALTIAVAAAFISADAWTKTKSLPPVSPTSLGYER